MADSVRVFGQEMNKKTLYIGGAVALGALGFAWWRRKSSAGAGSASGSASATGASGGNVDPATGFAYGSPEDQAALAQQSGTGLGSGAGQDVYGIDPNTGNYGLYNPNTGSWIDTGGGPNTSSGSKSQTNAQWEQQAIADLQAGGVGHSIIGNAETGLPRYLAHLTLTSAQATAVQMAVGLAGPPPEGGPFAIRIHNPPHKPTSTKVEVPDVLGMSFDSAAHSIERAGLKAKQEGPGRIVQERPAAGTEVERHSTVVLFGANK